MALNRRHLLWAFVALAGIAVTAAVTWSITRLTGQHIGLASEPLSVVRGLAPSSAERPAHAQLPSTHRRRARTSPSTAVTSTSPPGITATVAPQGTVNAFPTPIAGTSPAASTAQTRAGAGNANAQAANATARSGSNGGSSTPSQDGHDSSSQRSGGGQDGGGQSTGSGSGPDD